MKFNINFYKPLPLFVLFSLFLTVGSITLMFTKGFKWGTDFTGGLEMTVTFKTPTQAHDIETVLTSEGIKVEIQPVITKPNRFYLRSSVPESAVLIVSNQGSNIAPVFSATIDQKIKTLITEKMATRTPVFEQSRLVGGVISGENKTNALMVMLYALIGIGLYMTFRFKMQFSFGALIAVFHDIIVMLGALAFTQREISILTISAILTIMGYTINETIVLFDRVRENLKSQKYNSFGELINSSINEVFTRTIIMISLTLSVVVVLYFNSVGSLQDFSFALIIGMLSGTYSSIYVAAAYLLGINRVKSQM
jgi:preprotein translocase subunit SecF